jgi:rhodanese-related sulfurtransferase/DNA-directed RNA polymerase subunit RPC12/RpoP
MKRLIPFISLGIFLLLGIINLSASSQAEYQCLPCGNDCDKDSFSGPGTCPHCHMQLVKKSTVHFKNVEPDQICKYISAHPNALLLDVRTKEEFEGKSNPDFGTLKNAINLPVQELDKRMSELDKYKDKEIIVYCSHSHRSPMASYMLTQHGFNNVTNMLGGMSVLKDDACKK